MRGREERPQRLENTGGFCAWQSRKGEELQSAAGYDEKSFAFASEIARGFVFASNISRDIILRAARGARKPTGKHGSS